MGRLLRARKLQKVAVDGGAPVTLCDAPGDRGGGGGTWGDDDNIVAALEGVELAKLVNTARTSQPFSNPLSVPVVVDADVSPERGIHVLPPLTDNCH